MWHGISSCVVDIFAPMPLKRKAKPKLLTQWSLGFSMLIQGLELNHWIFIFHGARSTQHEYAYLNGSITYAWRPETVASCPDLKTCRVLRQRQDCPANDVRFRRWCLLGAYSNHSPQSHQVKLKRAWKFLSGSAASSPGTMGFSRDRVSQL